MKADDTTAVDDGTETVAPGRAAQELDLRRDEFRLAVQMGLVRTVPTGKATGRDRGGGPDPAPERRRVTRRELDRLRGAPDFPDGLRERVRAVGTREAAELLAITHDRFTRLARAGQLSPVRFYLNRYRAVVWLYVAAEVTALGEARPDLLTGRLPADLREAAAQDLRARNWRARRLGLLLRSSDDPWARAAAIASLLDPVQLAEVVDDPYERHQLDRLRPAPPPGRPAAGAGREIADRLVLADDPDEILWHRMSLALALDEARAERQAPHPGDVPHDLRAEQRRPSAVPPSPRAGHAPPVVPPPMIPAQAQAPVAARPPGRPVGLVTRPPGRRTRRGLLDRLRRRRGSAGGETVRRAWGPPPTWP